MDYKMKMEKRGDYLYYYVSGSDSLEISKAFWREIIETSIKLNYKKVLVDENLKGSVSLGEVYEVVMSAIDIPDIRTIRIALIDRHIDQSEVNRFWETVAVNRGINVKIFTLRKDAKKWLLS